MPLRNTLRWLRARTLIRRPSTSVLRRSTTRLLLETLEDRLAPATASAVEFQLLPTFIAQLADNNNQLPASDAWWALRSQRNLALDEPISKVLQMAGHNAYNSLNEGFRIVPGVSPNQILSMRGQLDLGVRLLELDIHDPDFDGQRPLVLKHGPPPPSLTRSQSFRLSTGLSQIRSWLDRPENRHEVIFLDIEDATSEAESSPSTEDLIPLLQNSFGSLIYTPAARAADGGWASRRELIARNQRVIIFTHRNDTQDGRFGPAVAHTDPNGHVWYSADLAFRANGEQDPVTDRGNFTQDKVDGNGNAPFNPAPEDADFFFAMTSDAFRVVTSVPKAEPAAFRAAAETNIDFVKVDFWFSDDEDAGLGSIGNDRAFDIAQDNRVRDLENLVWSWAANDPAVDRQIFQDLLPGDGTGLALVNLLVGTYGVSPARIAALDVAGHTARLNFRDVAVIRGDGRWESLLPVQHGAPRPFAARSLTPNSAGVYDWRVTTGTSINWSDGPRIVQSEFGNNYVFAAPVNGFQNSQLRGILGGQTWINLQDFDRDGSWNVGDFAGNTLTTARDLGTGQTVSRDVVNAADVVDLYRFTLPVRGSISARLDGLSANANLFLIRDANGDGSIQPSEILGSSQNAGAASELLTTTRDAGTYYLDVASVGTASTAYTLTLNSDFAGNTLAAARVLGPVTGQTTYSDFVNPADVVDFYVFSLNQRGSITARLDGLGANANLFLIRDANNDGTIQPSETLASSQNTGAAVDQLGITLEPGTYYLDVASVGTDSTNYALSLTVDFAGGSLTAARALGTVAAGRTEYRDFVNPADVVDFYRFTLPVRASISARLDGLSANANLFLIRDANGDNSIQFGEILASSQNTGAAADQIGITLEPGTYYLDVASVGTDSTNYTLALTVDFAGNVLPAARDLGSLPGQLFAADFVSATSDSIDDYRFNLAAPGSLQVQIDGLAANANVHLIRDANADGVIQPAELLLSSSNAFNSFKILNATTLAAGVYYVHVVPDFVQSTQTSYNLRLTADYAGSTLATARNLGTLSSLGGSLSAADFVGFSPIDGDDYFVVRQLFTGPFFVRLEPTGGDANLRVIEDKNGDRAITADEVLGSSFNAGTATDQVSLSSLKGGVDYFIHVLPGSTVGTNYRLTLLPTIPPMIRDDTLTAEIDEGGSAVLSGQLVDPDVDDVLSLVVDWGDGSPVQTEYPGLEPFAFDHTYRDDGTYNVTFTWLDDKGGSNSRTRQVVVHNVAPVLVFETAPRLVGPQTYRFRPLVVDPGSDAFRVQADWGDGTATGLRRFRPGHAFGSHRYKRPGTYLVTFTVFDDEGAATTVSFSLRVRRSGISGTALPDR